jgi:hypothetical protein
VLVVFLVVTVKFSSTRNTDALDVIGQIECCGRAEKARKAVYTGNALERKDSNAVSRVKNFHARHIMIQEKPFTLNRFSTVGKN